MKLQQRDDFIRNASTHFSDFPELPRPVVAADPTDGQGGVEQFNKALGVQLQVAKQRFHTWSKNLGDF